MCLASGSRSCCSRYLSPVCWRYGFGPREGCGGLPLQAFLQSASWRHCACRALGRFSGAWCCFVSSRRGSRILAAGAGKDALRLGLVAVGVLGLMVAGRTRRIPASRKLTWEVTVRRSEAQRGASPSGNGRWTVPGTPGLGRGSRELATLSELHQRSGRNCGFASRTFSLPLQLLTEKGIVGLLLYGAVFSLAGWEMHRRRELIACCLFAGLVAVLARELTYSSLLEHPVTAMLTATILGLICRSPG